MTRNRTSRKRRSYWLPVAAVIVLAVAAYFYVQSRPRPGDPATAPDGTARIERDKAFIGTISGATTASGSVRPIGSARLSVASPGLVQEVLVAVGDLVSEGDLLMTFDPGTAAQALEQARLRLLDAQLAADSSKLERDAAKADLRVDQAMLNLASAAANLDELASWSPDIQRVEVAQIELQNARSSLQQAQAAYDRISWMGGAAASPQAVQLEKATNALKIAQSNLAALSDDNPSTASAEAQVASAEIALKEAQLAVEDQQYTASRTLTDLERAKLEYGNAELNLERTELRSTLNGVVVAIKFSVGEYASGVAIELAGTEQYEVVLSVDEIDVGSIVEGQPAVVTLEAWPGERFSSQVASVSPVPNSSSSSIVTYDVSLSLDGTDLPLRSGMTANASLTTYELDQVLLVPNKAIVPDRETGKYYVNIVAGNSFERIEVVIGVRNREFTQIVDGLADGQLILLGEPVQGFSFGQPDGQEHVSGAGGPFGGD